MFVCLIVCPIITQEPWSDLTQILIGEPASATGMFLAWFYDFKLSGLKS